MILVAAERSEATLCLDIDNVVAQTDDVMRHVIRTYTDGRVDLRYVDVKEFDYHKCVDSRGASIAKEDWPAIHDLFSESRHIAKISPFDDVQTCLRRLSERYDLHLATARLPKARGATVEWLETHGFPNHSLHFLSHGRKHLSLGGFAAAVEDDLAQARAFAAHGVPCYVLAHPWNEFDLEIEDVHRVNSWGELTDHLLTA